MTDTIPALEIVESILKRPKTSEELTDQFSISDSTLHRRIAVARSLGIDVRFTRKAKHIQGDPKDPGKLHITYPAKVRNRAEVEPQIRRWLEVVRSQDATQATAPNGYLATRSDTGEKVIILAATQSEAEAWASEHLEPAPDWRLDQA